MKIKRFFPNYMDDREFQRRSDLALEDLNRKLMAADFESDFNAGALTIEFEDPPARFVVSPNSPVRQVWVSALTRSFKLEWDEARNTFVLPDTKQTLTELIQSAIAQQTGEEVAL